ncbi:10564_t:CDS:2 [Gigaspora rosea]|nr:10564_t:CDS:2 [Gigaspora rosea]
MPVLEILRTEETNSYSEAMSTMRITVMELEDRNNQNRLECRNKARKNNKMMTESVNTIKTNNGIPRTYSQVLARDMQD